ncbi:MAG TPA: class I SAM-dependent methyltransferase [Flavisolibacter sp.]|nr:class I SAM-dependent methyltransferase [Flavisolibacter sp.]
MSSLTAFAGNIPHNYDTYLGPLFFEPYAIDLVQQLQGNDYQSVLELACGTGRVTTHLVEKIAPGGSLQAMDLNEDMLRIAKSKLPDSRIVWSVADAHRLPFADGQFEVVVCQFGVMFFEDKPKALREVFRVLKQGGRFYFNTWDRIEFNAVADVARQTLQQIFPDDPPAFIEKGPYSFFDPELIRQLLEDAGFTSIEIERVPRTSVAPSPEDVTAGFLDGTTLRPYLQERHSQDAAVRQLFRELLVLRYGERDLELPMQAFVCEAIKP